MELTKTDIILKIEREFPYLSGFKLKDLHLSELNRLSESLQLDRRLNSISIGSLVIGEKSLTSISIVFSFSEAEPLVLWQDGFKSICKIEQLKLAPAKFNQELVRR